jgi:hypothetical protein
LVHYISCYDETSRGVSATRDMLLQTLLTHRMLSVVQAIMRGMMVRNWFRASLMEASSRIADRSYFKRLAAIGVSSGNVGGGNDGLDILAQQVHSMKTAMRMQLVQSALQMALTASLPAGEVAHC